MTKKRAFVIAITPCIEVTVDVDTTPEEVIKAAVRAEKLLIRGIRNGQGVPPIRDTVLLFVQLIKSSLVRELCFDIEKEEFADILDILLYEPGYAFSAEFPYTREQILAVVEGTEGQ